MPAAIQRFTPLGAPVSYLALVLLAAAQSIDRVAASPPSSTGARLPFEVASAPGVLAGASSIPTIFA